MVGSRRKDSHVVVGNVIVLFLKQSITWSLTTVLILYLPRYLGDTGLGEVTFATSFTGMFSIVILLGVPTYLVKEVARDKSSLGRFYFNSLMMRIPLSVLVFAIVVVFGALMGYSAETKSVIYVASLVTIFQCLNDTAASILQGIENMKWSSAADVAGKVVITGAGIAVLVQGHGVLAYVVVLMIGTATSLLINMSYFVFRMKIKPSIDLRVWRSLVVGGVPFLLTAVLSTLYQRIDATMLRFLSTEAVVGWYGAASQLLGTLNFVPILVGAALLPALARLHTTDSKRMVAGARRSLSLTIVMSLPMAAGTMLLSDKIIGMLHYPAAFQNSVPLLGILAASLPVTSVLMVMGTVVMAADKQSQWAIVTGAGLVIDVLLNLLLIPAATDLYGNGAIGTAVTAFLAEALILILAVRLVPKGVIDQSVALVLAKSVAGVILMALAVWKLRDGNLVLVIAFGALVYGSFSLMLKSIRLDDLLLVRDVLLRRGVLAGR